MKRRYKFKIGETVRVKGTKTVGKLRAHKVQNGRTLNEVSTNRGRLWYFTSELTKA